MTGVPHDTGEAPVLRSAVAATEPVRLSCLSSTVAGEYLRMCISVTAGFAAVLWAVQSVWHPAAAVGSVASAWVVVGVWDRLERGLATAVMTLGVLAVTVLHTFSLPATMPPWTRSGPFSLSTIAVLLCGVLCLDLYELRRKPGADHVE